MSLLRFLLILIFTPAFATISAQQDFKPYFSGSFIGSFADDYGYTILNTGDRIYVSGITYDSAFPVTSGAIQPAFGGGTDLFIAAFDTSGQLLWSTYYGGSGLELSPRLSSGNNGNILLTAYSNSTDFPVSSGAWQPVNNGSYDAVLMKLDTSGQLIWCTLFGGSSGDLGIDIKCDAEGNIYLGGQTMSIDLPVTSGVHQISPGGATDAFLAKFSPSGQLRWCSFFGGSMSEDIHTITLNKQTDLIITGMTNSSDMFLTPGAWQPGLAGNFDIYFSKWDTAGNLKWNTYFGGLNDDDALSIVCDTADNIWFAGTTNSTDFEVTSNAWQSTSAGGNDAILGTFNTNGQLLFSTYLGGALYDSGVMLDSDEYGSLYLLMQTENQLPTGDSLTIDSTYNGNTDTWLLKFNASTHEREFASYFGGPGQDIPQDLSVHDTTVAFAGSSTGVGIAFPDSATFQATAAGNYDAFWAYMYFNTKMVNDTTDTTDTSSVFYHSRPAPPLIYPNPATDHFNLKTDPCGAGEIRLTDATGKTLGIVYGEGRHGISGLRSGIYYLVKNETDCRWSVPLLIINQGK